MKYVVSEAKAAAIRKFVRMYLAPDVHAASGNPPGYDVHSLYLDASHLPLYQQSVNGEKNRFKLRIRYYDATANSPVYLEIKRRTTESISKSRAAVPRASAEAFLQGKRLGSCDLITADNRSKAALARFCELCDVVQAHGSVFVSYRREAYVHPAAATLRVTFDRQLVGAPYREGDRLAVTSKFHRAAIAGVILELKYQGRFPGWMGRLVQTFDLQRRSVPKYVECFDVLPRACLQNGWQLAL